MRQPVNFKTPRLTCTLDDYYYLKDRYKRLWWESDKLGYPDTGHWWERYQRMCRWIALIEG